MRGAVRWGRGKSVSGKTRGPGDRGSPAVGLPELQEPLTCRRTDSVTGFVVASYLDTCSYGLVAWLGAMIALVV